MKLRVIALLLSFAACRLVDSSVAHNSNGREGKLGKDAYGEISRLDFNQRAQERFAPVFWRSDENHNDRIDPSELVVLRGPWDLKADDLVQNGQFTDRFAALYQSIVKADDFSPLALDEQARRTALKSELAQGKPTLVETATSTFSAEDRAIVENLSLAAKSIERLYAKQHATSEMTAKIPADDLLSQAVFHRNQSPFCVAPKTENNAACSVFVERPPRQVGLYPANIQSDAKFCSALEKQPNKSQLMDHFSVVVADGAKFKSVGYHEAWKDEMETAATHLLAAAAAIKSDSEGAFKNYLEAAARAFRTNDWESANKAWAAMSATNSKWYLRAAADEVYHEPCAWKAGFALQLARINPESLAWQQRLEPVKQQMEQQLAMFAGKPYKERQVQFKLPDFIDIVINAGDQRPPHGATIGQSLPNWGAVAAKGGRTVVMTNLYTDADSRAALEGQMSSLFCKATMALASTDPKTALMSIVLHEAAHNLGPAHDYAVKGQKDDDVFGGTLAATMEELKAQTSALYFTWWLAERKIISETDATQAAVRDIAWAFGHVSRGMYDAGGNPRNYSQLASIQLGMALKSGALSFVPTEMAANGKDTGCFEVDLGKWRSTIDAMAHRVLAIKGRGDKKGAEALKAEFVDAAGPWADQRAIIGERWLRAPKATFVYSY